MEHSTEDSTEGNSVVPLGRPAATMAPEVFRSHLHAILVGNQEPPSDLQSTLDAFPPSRLWSLLDWLSSADGEEGKRLGLAVVVLSRLAKKDPVKAVTYLTAADSPFGLSQSSAGLMAFRQALTQWSAQDPQAAITALESYRQDPELAEKISALTEMHSERLEVTLAGAMPVTDLAAVTARWNTLERKEAGSLLPRFLERLPSAAEREELLDRTAVWLGEQWKNEGPGVVFQWALGLPDDSLQNRVLSRLPAPPDAAGEGE